MLDLNTQELVNLTNLILSNKDEYLVFDRRMEYKDQLDKPIFKTIYSTEKCQTRDSSVTDYKKILTTGSGEHVDFGNSSSFRSNLSLKSEIIREHIIQNEISSITLYRIYKDTDSGLSCLKYLDQHTIKSPEYLDTNIAALKKSINDCWLIYYLREIPEIIDDKTSGYIFDSRYLRRFGKYLLNEKIKIFAMSIRSGKEKDSNVPKLREPILVHTLDNQYFHQNKLNFDISTEFKNKIRIAFESGHSAFSLNGDILVSELHYNEKQMKWKVNEPENISGREPSIDGWDGKPKFSPDGTKVAFIRQDIPQDEAAMKDIFVHTFCTGTTSNLTKKLDRPISEFYWSCDGNCIIALADNYGKKMLYMISVESTHIEPICVPHDMPAHIHDFVVTRKGDKILTIASSFNRPKEVYCLERKTDHKYAKSAKWKYTNENKEFLESNDGYLPCVHEYFVKSDNSLGEIPVYLLLPGPKVLKSKEKIPLILSVHGGPTEAQNNLFDIELANITANGYAVALPNPTGSIGFGQKYTDAVKNDWGGQVYKDLVAVLEDLVNMREEFNLDIERFGAMGTSFGGYMMAWLQSHPPILKNERDFKLKALVSVNGVYDLHSWARTTDELWYPIDQLNLHAGQFNPYHQFNPAQYSEHFSNIPTLVIAGEKDYRVPMNQSIQFFTALKDNCVPSRLVILPSGLHGFTPKNEGLSTASKIAWFDQFLKQETLPKNANLPTAFTNAQEAYIRYPGSQTAKDC